MTADDGLVQQGFGVRVERLVRRTTLRTKPGPQADDRRQQEGGHRPKLVERVI